MSFHSQDQSFLTPNKQKSNKRKKHDNNNMKTNKLHKLLTKQMQDQLSEFKLMLTKEFEQKYAEKEKQLQEMKYKL